MHWKIKITIGIILSVIIIGYPFFAIKYFEIETTLKITTTYFLIPITIVLSVFGPRFYYKKVKPHDRFQTTSKPKEKARDILSIIMMVLCSSMLFSAIFFSLIITTNSFGYSVPVEISEPVLKYHPKVTKNGRLRHYIDIINPKTKRQIHLEVYREYAQGEIFEKEMKYGLWGILYSRK